MANVVFMIFPYLYVNPLECLAAGDHGRCAIEHTDDDSISEQLRQRVKLFHMLRHDLDDDDDRNAEQHAPDAPQPAPEQQ